MELNISEGLYLLKKWNGMEPTYVGYVQYIEDKSISSHSTYVLTLAHGTYVAKDQKNSTKETRQPQDLIFRVTCVG